jgi:hypothetical protein
MLDGQSSAVSGGDDTSLRFRRSSMGAFCAYTTGKNVFSKFERGKIKVYRKNMKG